MISLVFSLSPKFGLSQNKKIYFTFWFNFRSVRILDWAKRLRERLIQKVKSPNVFYDYFTSPHTCTSGLEYFSK